MKTRIYTIADGRRFQPTIFALLGHPALVTHHRERDLPHPLSGLTFAWAQVMRAFERVAAQLKGVDFQPSDEAGATRNLLLEAHQQLLYRIAELIDVLENSVALSLSNNPKKPIALLAGHLKLRASLMMPCNKLKHEGDRLCFTGITTAIFKVSGYRHMRQRDEKMVPNSTFHSDLRPAISFNVELRRLMVDIYTLLEGASDNLCKLQDLAAPSMGPYAPDKITSGSLAAVVALPTCVLPDEDAFMPTLLFDGQSLTMAPKGGSAISSSGMAMQTLSSFEGDGVTRTFQFVDWA